MKEYERSPRTKFGQIAVCQDLGFFSSLVQTGKKGGGKRGKNMKIPLPLNTR
ncbi:unnamed protein product, partial [marine sediment metagenome]